jgi:hypothetical protein
VITCLRVQVKRGQDSWRYRWPGIGDGDWGFAKGSRQDSVRSSRRLFSYCIGTFRGQRQCALLCGPDLFSGSLPTLYKVQRLFSE